jgi:hypothetical protein
VLIESNCDIQLLSIFGGKQTNTFSYQDYLPIKIKLKEKRVEDMSKQLTIPIRSFLVDLFQNSG